MLRAKGETQNLTPKPPPNPTPVLLMQMVLNIRLSANRSQVAGECEGICFAASVEVRFVCRVCRGVAPAL